VKSVQLAAGGTRTYCYDANGNLTGDDAGLSIAYDHQNLPYKATRGAQTDWFRYGADGMRTRSWGADGSRVYLPGYEHRTDTGETKVYVGDYAVISRIGSTRKVEYLLKDRLGSVDAVANASGTVIETRGYDAFGKPRDGSWNDLNPAKIASTAVTPKGFTQHEHLNQLELIHMNGRAYDYQLGRFTGVDPFIQFPLNSQSMNPYSYILNNPLSGTDPTGYAACTDQKAGPGDGEVCQITVTVGQKQAGSHITKSTTATYTVANNGGVYYIAAGSGAKANAAITAAIIGEPKDRPNTPTMRNAPRAVGERPASGAMCSKAGTRCEAEQFLYDPSEPSWLRKTAGDVAGSFRNPDKDGYRINPLTDQPVQNPQATRETTLVNLLTLAMPGPKLVRGLSNESKIAESGFIHPRLVRFSQDSIKSTFKNGASLREMVTGLLDGGIDPSKVPAIRLVDMDGVLYTLDNRRLEAFRRAGMDVPYRMATRQEAAKESWKFTTNNNGRTIQVRGED
jgi:RHS repeat-associated protein